MLPVAFGQTRGPLSRKGKDRGKEEGGEFHNLGLFDSFFSESGHTNSNLRNGILITITLEFTSESQSLGIDLGRKAFITIQIYYHAQVFRK